MNLTDFFLTISIATAVGFVLGFFTNSMVSQVRRHWLNRHLSYFKKYNNKDDVL
ncbi:hypothetical protein [Photobacterium proteolyticum]|uniref:hypothetical protein n=1 Tax=Photobacterium proteolyticum TaxID=1903952 RepID=UPI000A72CC0B|nr:hypothetical protein [Photobacterium proteolyticum]